MQKNIKQNYRSCIHGKINENEAIQDERCACTSHFSVIFPNQVSEMASSCTNVFLCKYCMKGWPLILALNSNKSMDYNYIKN